MPTESFSSATRPSASVSLSTSSAITRRSAGVISTFRMVASIYSYQTQKPVLEHLGKCMKTLRGQKLVGIVRKQEPGLGRKILSLPGDLHMQVHFRQCTHREGEIAPDDAR